MAELHVQPKRNNYWWIWLLLAIIIIGGAIYYYVNYYQKGKSLTGATNTDSTSYVSTDSTSYVNAAATDSSSINLGEANLWDQIDFNSPDTTYPEVTDKNIKTQSNAHFVIYSLASQNLFTNNKSDLSNEGKQRLNQIGNSIYKRFNSADVKVYDRTDTSHENQMAMQRGETVANYLVNNSKLNQSHVTVYQPANQTSMPHQNDMVDIVVKR